MKELELTVKIRNNRLKQRRLALGMTQEQFAKAAGVNRMAYAGLETMRDAPKRRMSTWRQIVIDVSRFHCVDPEELFPPSVLAIETAEAIRLVDGCDLHRMLTSQHQQRLLEDPGASCDRRDLHDQMQLAVARLSPREAQLVTLRYGLDGKGERTLAEIGKVFGKSVERMRQSINTTLRQLRRPRLSGELVPFK